MPMVHNQRYGLDRGPHWNDDSRRHCKTKTKRRRSAKDLYETTIGHRDGDNLHVLRDTEEASFLTIGKCTWDVTTSSDQGLGNSARR